MAHATHLTIGTADRIRLDARQQSHGREDEEGGDEVRQEVQVSITYALEAGDTDLVRLAEAKAPEVQRAHEAVWNRIGAFSDSGNRRMPDRCSGRRRASDEEDDEEKDNGNDASDDDPQGAGLSPDPPPVDPPMGGPARGAWYIPGGSRSGNGTAGPELSRDTDVEPITGPQKILIRSRAKKVGLTPYALEALVFKQFRVWKVDRLTKEQATSLLAALERDLKGSAPEPRDGTESLARDGDIGHKVTTGTA